MQPSREDRLADAFVTMAGALVTEYDVVELLHNLVDHSMDLLDVAAAGLVLRDPRGGLEVLASSSEQSRLLELLQLEDDQGPCVESYTSGQVVVLEDANDTRAPWPAFRVGALEYGFRSVHAVPMRLGSQTIGALNLFGTLPGRLLPADARIAQALTDVATIAILQGRALRESIVVSEQLQSALNSRVVIEQAKGVLAHHANVDMDTAFNMLRGYSRRNNQRLGDVATRVIDNSLDLGTMARPGTD